MENDLIFRGLTRKAKENFYLRNFSIVNLAVQYSFFITQSFLNKFAPFSGLVYKIAKLTWKKIHFFSPLELISSLLDRLKISKLKTNEVS